MYIPDNWESWGARWVVIRPPSNALHVSKNERAQKSHRRREESIEHCVRCVIRRS